MKRYFFLLLVLFWTVQAFAGVFVWTDEKGNTYPISNEESLYFVDEDEKKLLKMKLEQVQQQVKAIDKELEIFRNDARKAGVPPKYL